MLGKCPICHELFENAGEASVVQCGHVFHHHCILNWLERAKTCPSCRKPASPASLIRQIFVDLEDSFLHDKQNCAFCPTLTNERDDWKLKYSELKRSSEEQLKKKDKDVKDMERSLKALKSKNAKTEAANLALQTQSAESESIRKELEMVKAEAAKTRQNLNKYRRFHKLMISKDDEQERLLAESDRDLPQFFSTLKHQYKAAHESLKEMRGKLRNTEKQLQETKKRLENTEKLSRDLKEELKTGAGEALYSPYNPQLRSFIARDSPAAVLKDIPVCSAALPPAPDAHSPQVALPGGLGTGKGLKRRTEAVPNGFGGRGRMGVAPAKKPLKMKQRRISTFLGPKPASMDDSVVCLN